jgi:hypothetical protein
MDVEVKTNIFYTTYGQPPVHESDVALYIFSSSPDPFQRTNPH